MEPVFDKERMRSVLDVMRPYFKRDKQPAVRDIETIRALFQTIRCKLERRFQVSDYLADGGDRDDVRPVRVVVSDICQEVMAHVREIHAFAERGEKLALTISRHEAQPAEAEVIGLIQRVKWLIDDGVRWQGSFSDMHTHQKAQDDRGRLADYLNGRRVLKHEAQPAGG
jgi:hypothetical protein